MFVTGGNKVDAFGNVRVALEIKALVCASFVEPFFTSSRSAKHGTPVLRISIRTVHFHDKG